MKLLKKEDVEKFLSKGYLVIPGGVDLDLVHRLHRTLNLWRAKVLREGPTAEDKKAADSWHSAVSQEGCEAMDHLARRFAPWVEAIIGPWKESNRQFAGQAPSYQDEVRYHIDGCWKWLQDPVGFGPLPGFDLLIGVQLSPHPGEEMNNQAGQLCIWPLGFSAVKDLFATEPTRQVVQAIQDNRYYFGNPMTPVVHPGDVIILHPLLPHHKDPNLGPTFSDRAYIRYKKA